MNTMIIGFTTAACVLIYAIWSVLKFSKIKIPKPGVYKNKTKEKKLLNVILKDMKNNAGNWILQKDEPVMRDGNLMVNDKTNMAVRYNSEGVTLYFNLKNIATFEKKTSDTLITTINGRQAIKFINKAISILDHRGKELAYLTQKIEERL